MNDMIERYREQRERSMRTREEILKCHHFSTVCAKLISKYWNKIPIEDYKFFHIYDGHSAFLPISIKKHLTQFDINLTMVPLGKSTHIDPTI